MALKVELKPNERIIIGNAVIRNGEQRARFFIEGDAPILREKDILTAATANTPAKRVYLAIQMMYISDDSSTGQAEYFALVDEFLRAVPSSADIVNEINNELLTGALYKALKAAHRLVDYEQDLISHASARRSGLPPDSQDR